MDYTSSFQPFERESKNAGIEIVFSDYSYLYCPAQLVYISCSSGNGNSKGLA